MQTRGCMVTLGVGLEVLICLKPKIPIFPSELPETGRLDAPCLPLPLPPLLCPRGDTHF